MFKAGVENPAGVQEESKNAARRAARLIRRGYKRKLMQRSRLITLLPISGVAPRQAAQRHRSRYEAELVVRFVGADKLVHLIGKGEGVPRLGRSFADRRHQHVIQAGDGISDRNQLAAFTLHGLFFHVHQTRQGSA